MTQSAITVTPQMRERARALEPDRYLAALLAPAPVRDDLITLAAFVAELGRIPVTVSDPHLAEIRLAWWRDGLLDGADGKMGDPCADAMRALIARHGLDRAALATWLEAFAHTLYPAAPEDAAHLDLELRLLEGTPFIFAAQICGAPPERAQRACETAAQAYGLARVGLNFPRALARGRCPLPGFTDDADGAAHEVRVGAAAIDAASARAALGQLAAARVAAAKAAFAAADRPVRTALLPLALVEPYLRASCHEGHDLTHELADVAPLVRVWRLWRAHMTGRV